MRRGLTGPGDFSYSRQLDSEGKRVKPALGFSSFSIARESRGKAKEFPDWLSISKLLEKKKVALRQGLWFRALNRVERGILDLTVKYVDCIRSSKLAKVLTAIMEKLKLASESTAERITRTIGIPLAQKMSAAAVNWGNRSALAWAKDLGFARYLAICLVKATP